MMMEETEETDLRAVLVVKLSDCIQRQGGEEAWLAQLHRQTGDIVRCPFGRS
jgi:hypothetical protein